MNTDPLRFSETYDPPPRDQSDRSEYDLWLDTLDHHTIGECECADCGFTGSYDDMGAHVAGHLRREALIRGQVAREVEAMHAEAATFILSNIAARIREPKATGVAA